MGLHSIATPFFKVKRESTSKMEVIYFLSLLFSGRTPACPKQAKLTGIIMLFFYLLDLCVLPHGLHDIRDCVFISLCLLHSGDDSVIIKNMCLINFGIKSIDI